MNKIFQLCVTSQKKKINEKCKIEYIRDCPKVYSICISPVTPTRLTKVLLTFHKNLTNNTKTKLPLAYGFHLM